MKIALTGRKRSGKSEVAGILRSRKGYEILSLADPMKDIAGFMFGWGRTEIETRKEDVDPRYGISPRQFLQVFGTEFAQHMLSDMFPDYDKTTGRLLWVRRLLQSMASMGIGDSSKVVVPDVRFPHEASALREAGFTLVGVMRPGYADDSHESEQSFYAIKVSHTILNDGTLVQLNDRVDRLMLELR